MSGTEDQIQITLSREEWRLLSEFASQAVAERRRQYDREHFLACEEDGAYKSLTEAEKQAKYYSSISGRLQNDFETLTTKFHEMVTGTYEEDDQ